MHDVAAITLSTPGGGEGRGEAGAKPGEVSEVRARRADEVSAPAEPTIAALAAAITARDAAQRAAVKAAGGGRKLSPCEARLLDRRTRFLTWCDNALHAELRRADATLAPTGYRMKEIRPQQPPAGRRLLEDESPRHVLATTTLVLGRDNGQHVLTLTLHGDGMVTAVHRPPDGAPGMLCAEMPVTALGPEQAKAVVGRFGAKAIS